MKLLYFVPSSSGGIADYAHEQANALAQHGVEVDVLCTPRFARRDGRRYEVIPGLLDQGDRPLRRSRVLRGIGFVATIARNIRRLAQQVRNGRYGHVLLDSYIEYGAPLWARVLRRLAGRGVVFGAIVHDPVRNYVVGPGWWHRWSVAEGYSFLRVAFVHEQVTLDTVRRAPGLRTVRIPFGLYPAPAPTRSRGEVRVALDVPISAPLILAFGSIRDDKNLDLLIRALASAPSWYLVVAGDTISTRSRPVAEYQALARELGVAARCRWRIGYVAPGEMADLFTASDLVALAYGASFRSQSAVLSTAIAYRVRCVASGGEGPMQTAVREYALGRWVAPDDACAIAEALRAWPWEDRSPEWDRYAADHAWALNARLVMAALTEAGSSSHGVPEGRAS